MSGMPRGKTKTKGRKGRPRKDSKNLRARRLTTRNKLRSVRKAVAVCEASGMAANHPHMQHLIGREVYWTENNARGRGVHI